jgi:hypothetical protein
MKFRISLLVALTGLSSTALLADFQYEQTVKFTGGFLTSVGRLAGRQAMEPQVSTVLLKGNKMATVSPQSTQIIDLDAETITSVDHTKKTYSVMTFQQMKEQMENAMREMDKQRGQQNADVRFDANVRDTGKTKDVNGLPAKQFVLTLSMVGTDKKSGESGAMHFTNEMWMASGMRGYEEVSKFQERMAQKIGTMFQGSNLAMMQPGMGKGMAEMAKEMSKVEGIPVLQVMRIGSTADNKPLPPASEAPELSKQSQVQMPGAGDVAGQAAGSAVGSAIGGRLGRLGGAAGGLGGLGRRRQPQQEEPQPQPEAQAQGQGQPAALMMAEVTTEMTSFSSGAVDATKLEVPAGFKQVESDLGRGRNRR